VRRVAGALAAVAALLAALAGWPAPSAEAKYLPIFVLERTLKADAVLRGEIVALDDRAFTLRVDHVVAGGAAQGAEIRIERFVDWTCASRGDEYAVGQELYVWLAAVTEDVRGGPRKPDAPPWRTLGAGCEGEARIVDGDAYIRFAPGEAAVALGERVYGARHPVDDVDAALAAIRLLFVLDVDARAFSGRRARIATDREPDVRAGLRSENGLLRGVCEKALAR